MWIADPSSPIDITSGNSANLIWLLGIIVTTLGTLAGSYLLGRRRQAPPDPTPAPPQPEPEPVAAQSAREAVAEYRAFVQENYIDPLQTELDDERRERRLAEQAQAEAERVQKAGEAETERLRASLERALRELAEERRHRSD